MLRVDDVRPSRILGLFFVVTEILRTEDLFVRGERLLVRSSEQDGVIDKLVAKADRSDNFTAHNTDLLVLDSRGGPVLQLQHSVVDEPENV